MDNHRIPEILLENIQNSLCIPWCGAGLSKACGLPLWEDLAMRMIESTYKSKLITKEEYEELLDLHEDDKYEDVVDFCRLSMGQSEYSEFLEKIFGGDIEPSILHDCIAKLRVPAILTTNYDQLLEKSLFKRYKRLSPIFTAQDLSSIWRRIAKGDFFLLKLHGDITKPDTVILSSRDYTQHVFENNEFMQFLHNLFLGQSILFISTSFKDEYVKRLLEETMHMTKGFAMPHFAILADVGKIQAGTLRERFNVHVITYDSRKNTAHEENISSILEELSEIGELKMSADTGIEGSGSNNEDCLATSSSVASLDSVQQSLSHSSPDVVISEKEL